MIQIMIFILFTFVFSHPIFFATEAEAGNFGVGVHGGYGVINFEEKENYFRDKFKSQSRHEAILFGISGEYSFQRLKDFYIGIVTDWAFGFKDRETQKQDNVQSRIADMSIFGQYYDLRFGYKNNFKSLYYRVYASSGWDGLHFERDNVIWKGTPISGSTEDVSLWRAGLGSAFGYKLNSWILDGRAAYSYYFKGKTMDNSLPQYVFDTNGTCIDFGFGIAHEIGENMNLYLGGSYTLQRFEDHKTTEDITRDATMEILAGMINLSYAF